jgi:hypothetical protein
MRLIFRIRGLVNRLGRRPRARRRRVQNNMRTHTGTDGIPMLQGGSRRPGPWITRMRLQWASRAMLVAGAGTGAIAIVAATRQWRTSVADAAIGHSESLRPQLIHEHSTHTERDGKHYIARTFGEAQADGTPFNRLPSTPSTRFTHIGDLTLPSFLLDSSATVRSLQNPSTGPQPLRGWVGLHRCDIVGFRRSF